MIEQLIGPSHLRTQFAASFANQWQKSPLNDGKSRQPADCVLGILAGGEVYRQAMTDRGDHGNGIRRLGVRIPSGTSG
jgi:hypothetical protein